MTKINIGRSKVCKKMGGWSVRLKHITFLMWQFSRNGYSQMCVLELHASLSHSIFLHSTYLPTISSEGSPPNVQYGGDADSV